MERILIVDDEEAMRRLVARALARGGWPCTSAADAAEARARLAEEDYALVLCDVQMPGDSGLDLVKELPRDHPGTAAVMVTGLDDSELADAALEYGVYGYVIKPFKPNELVLTVMNALRRRRLELENERHRDRLEDIVEERTAALGRALSSLEIAAQELQLSREETIKRLSRAVEYRDPETGGHVERMSRYCGVLAERLALDSEAIRMASPLHDVGKIAVSDTILRKRGPLTASEVVDMQRHAEIGYRLLSGSRSGLLELGAIIAWSHHERYDGGGYPRGLVGEEIPVEGRIASVADAFDAMTSDRVYRPALPLSAALEVMRAERGRQFDPNVVDVLLDSLDAIREVRERFSESSAGGAGALVCA